MAGEMRIVKDSLFAKYGLRCEVCKKEFSEEELTGHHIIMQCRGGPTTEKNVLLACVKCHFEVINKIEYGTEEYWELMNECLKHRQKEEN